jgi:hypothetical protein
MWQTVHNAETGGFANVDVNAVEQLKGRGWEPVGDPTEVPRPLTADALNGLMPPPIDGAPAELVPPEIDLPPEIDGAPADDGIPPASDKPTKSKKAADAASEKEMTRGE